MRSFKYTIIININIHNSLGISESTESVWMTVKDKLYS